MTLVNDTLGANLNPSPKTFKMYKTLSATAPSGSPDTDTQAFFSKNCPFPVKNLGFEVQCVSVSGAGFNGSGSAMTVALQSSDEVDVSPASPTVVVWDTVVTIDCSGSVASTDKQLLTAPANSGSVNNASLDQTYVEVPKGGSLRATLSAQAADSIGITITTPVELLAIVECVPTSTKYQISF